MDAKVIALIAVAVLGMVCLAPLAAEDTSAETQDIRISNKYIFRADTEVDTKNSPYDIYFYMIDGTPNHKAMEDYIKNPKTAAAPTGDDRALLNTSAGEYLHIYSVQEYGYSVIMYGNKNPPSELCLRPFGLMDYIDYDIGDVVSVKILGASSDNGGDFGRGPFICSSGSGSNTIVYTNSTYAFTVDDETEVTIKPNNYTYNFYYTLKCDIEVSPPNGSATAFIAVCFVMSAVTIALLALGALKPKWSK